LVGGALPTYLFAQVPQDDRPAYLAWYNLALNAAVLLGVLLGPLLADWFDLQIALALSFVFRFASALVMWAVERNQTHPLPTTSAR
jgi:predicted MFS family arabinose efflux permease